jgi:hypothetical protein
MSLLKTIKRATRGAVTPTTAALEAFRRSRAALTSRRERNSLDELNQAPAQLWPKLEARELLARFQSPREPKFFQGFREALLSHNQLFRLETRDLQLEANQILLDHTWPILGFGEKFFGRQIQWRRDPLSGYLWPLDYHRDINLLRSDGSDIRVVWELNRLGHLLTLARCYALTRDEQLSLEFFAQLESWTANNPFGCGPNWTSAMEVALRTINLLGAFEVFRFSPQLNESSLLLALRLFQQHATYIRNNLEFSYLATSNHYLSDVVGLLWLGIMLPELKDSEWWADFGLVHMLREMDKQILSDGADFESSTGYHRFVLELLLYSFILCRENSIHIDDKYWGKLHVMLRYLRSYLRPDGLAPVIGDSDSGQVLPIKRHRANDHAYLLAIGAVLCEDPELKLEEVEAPEELLWLMGDEGVTRFNMLPAKRVRRSVGFPEAGIFIMRDGDSYLCFNASGPGLNGRGSHGHNDALSLEISVCGQSFLVDPGTYIYTADLQKRNQFRSTAYHSTVMVDGVEQSKIDESVPFVIGNEAQPRVLRWETGADCDRVSAEHYGYRRLTQPLVHRRSVNFDKPNRFWLIEDEFTGEGEHQFEVRFHFAPAITVSVENKIVLARNQLNNSRLILSCREAPGSFELEKQFVSFDYGHKQESVSVCLKFFGKAGKLNWLIVPLCDGEVLEERMRIVRSRCFPEVCIAGDS